MTSSQIKLCFKGTMWRGSLCMVQYHIERFEPYFNFNIRFKRSLTAPHSLWFMARFKPSLKFEHGLAS